jgi:hypothetical protein
VAITRGATGPWNPQGGAGDRYSVSSYRRAITRACVVANAEHWHPHQLRHSTATLVRKRFGIEAAQGVLGHSELETTQIYGTQSRTRPRGHARDWMTQDSLGGGGNPRPAAHRRNASRTMDAVGIIVFRLISVSQSRNSGVPFNPTTITRSSGSRGASFLGFEADLLAIASCFRKQQLPNPSDSHCITRDYASFYGHRISLTQILPIKGSK